MNSAETRIRKIIRKSKSLNQLLHDNRDGLMKLFNDYKRPTFSLNQAHRLFNTSGAPYQITLDANKPSLIGDLPGYGTVWYNPDGIANII